MLSMIGDCFMMTLADAMRRDVSLADDAEGSMI